MNNAISSAATGMAARQKSMDITGNNLANAETPGYKASELVRSPFGSFISYNTSEEAVGTQTFGTAPESIYTNRAQGAIYQTGRTLDFALNGNGYFTLQNEVGETLYTRGGSFTTDADGFLVNENGSYVMGLEGRINLGDTRSIVVSVRGEITSGGKITDRLLISSADDTAVIQRLAGGELMITGANTDRFRGQVIQKSLERSNVDFVQEMTRMIEDSRAFQSCSQILKMANQMTEKTVTEIGRV